MDLQHLNQFAREHWLEISGLLTLGVSLWIAFGPFRHRLPKVLTRFGKYSATLKLLGLSAFCWILLYKSLVDDEPSMALDWLLGSLGICLLAGAAFVVTRKQGARKPAAPRHPAAVGTMPPAKRTSKPQAGV
jgi:hypothetical protein